MSIGVGITQALDTFCTQAFGAKQYKLVGLHCQRAMAISTVACVPIIIIWCFTEPILNLVGVEPVRFLFRTLAFEDSILIRA